MKSKKLVYFIIAVLVIVVGFIVYDQTKPKVQAPTAENSNLSSPSEISQITEQTSQPEAQATTPPATNSNGGTFSGTEAIEGNDIAVFEVVYDGSSFSPSTLDIKQGDIVIFRNKSNTNFWPASAPHPSHTAYPEFDAKASIPAGGKFEFKFLKTGGWYFHDHLKPSATGKINVS